MEKGQENDKKTWVRCRKKIPKNSVVKSATGRPGVCVCVFWHNCSAGELSSVSADGQEKIATEVAADEKQGKDGLYASSEVINAQEKEKIATKASAEKINTPV